MIIDLVFIILLVLSVVKGISRGLIVAVFSFLAIIIGLAAAMKLSYIVANWLQDSFNTGKQWLPVLSFLIVMIGVILLVRWVANLIQAAVNFSMLGWLNRLGGVAFYLLLYVSVYSILLFYLTKMSLIKPGTLASSYTYSFIEPLGPKAISLLGSVIPLFKNLFQQLSDFFDNVAAKSA